MSNFGQRAASAAVLIVLALAATWAGGIAFRLFAAAIGAAVFYEWSAMTRGIGHGRHHLLLAGLLALVLAALVAGIGAWPLLALLAAAVVAGAAAGLTGGHGLWPAGGVAYAGLLATSLSFLRGADAAGLAAVLFLFAVVWASDSLAYFTGKALGGPKLAPAISPGKTWSGAAGGTLGGVLAGVALAVVFGALWGPTGMALLALGASLASQGGDLFESAMKRRFSIKDSGSLIPGHGGVMDRVDGLAAAALLVFALGAALAGPDRPAHAYFGS